MPHTSPNIGSKALCKGFKIPSAEMYCVFCKAAKSTAKLWKLKCTGTRHSFAKPVAVVRKPNGDGARHQPNCAPGCDPLIGCAKDEPAKPCDGTCVPKNYKPTHYHIGHVDSNDIEELLNDYSDWLHKHGYIDADYYAEEPRAVVAFLETLKIKKNG